MDSVLILTTVKDAIRYLPGYFDRLNRLTYPREKLSAALLESDSVDGTFPMLQDLAAQHAGRFANLSIYKKDYGFRMPSHLPRWEPGFQLARRNVLARSRNQLLFQAIGDHDWVLWLDVDVISFPDDLIEQLTSYNLNILHPDCVQEPGGKSFDLNAWTDDGKLVMHDLRGSGGPVRIESVGGTVLLVRGDVHRDGLIFPPFRYGVPSAAIRTRHPLWGSGEIETEGLAAMAHDMGVQCWGLPDLQVIHAPSEPDLRQLMSETPTMRSAPAPAAT